MSLKTSIREATLLNIIILNDTSGNKENTDPIKTGQIIELYKNNPNNPQVSDQALYKTIKKLNKEKLITETTPPEDTPNTQGPKPYYYMVKKDPETFLKIAEKYTKLQYLTLKWKTWSLFFNSTYTKAMINEDFLKIFEEESNLSFNEHERETVVNALKSSFYSLSNIIEFLNDIIHFKESEKRFIELPTPPGEKEYKKTVFVKNELKDRFLNLIQLGIGREIDKVKNILNQQAIIEPKFYIKKVKMQYKINYEVKIKLTPTKLQDIKKEDLENRNNCYINKEGEIISKATIINDIL